MELPFLPAMLKYFKRKSDSTLPNEKNEKCTRLDTAIPVVSEKNDKVTKSSVEINYAKLPTDPGLRPSILDYKPNVRDQVRREYMQNGPCQPKQHNFPLRQIGKEARRFNPKWFENYPHWLEYSISKDIVYCLCCYLFRPCNGEQSGGDSFVGKEFSNWKKRDRLQVHVGGLDSAHNEAWTKFEAMRNQKQNIENIISKKTKEACNEYRTRLTASLDCVRFLLKQGLPFRGHDEYEESSNQCNFLELLQFLADHNDEIKGVTLQNADKNLKLTYPDIQKDIVNAAATVVVNAIICNLRDTLFSILIDESRDISMKEQMAFVLRYVDKRGNVVERFIGIEHVTSTTALSLKEAIDRLLSRHGLSISRLRGQGYDGASNMQGELNGLKTLILKENSCAFYIYFFAHQLQLALIYVAKKHIQIASLFSVVGSVVNTVGASPKRWDFLQDLQATQINQAIKNGEIVSGRGLNQQTSLKRYGDTRWGSHYGTLISLVTMFSSIVGVLEIIVDDGLNPEQRCEASNLLDSIQSFDFVFSLHLMINILGVTNELSKALQRKDQDIINAMSLVRICKQRLQTMRENGWDFVFGQVSLFFQAHNINIPNMDDVFRARGRSRRRAQEVTNLHQFRVELFYSVIDMQLQELNDRFTEVNTELLLCVACLCPDDLFFAFDKNRLIQLAKYYPKDFSIVELVVLDTQLDTYIIDMRSSEDFKRLKGISALAKKMVETKKNDVYPLVYLLITLTLILPVATATVERVFSVMNIIKNRLRNRIGEQWLNDSLVVYIEKEIFDRIDNEAIIQYFQKMKSHRHPLQ